MIGKVNVIEFLAYHYKEKNYSTLIAVSGVLFNRARMGLKVEHS